MASSVRASWAPKVLSEYEVGRCVSAIEAVARMDKPIAEVGSQRVNRAELEADLKECLNLVGHSDGVQLWVRPSGKRFRFGFYREPWALSAIDFLSQTELDETSRAWISGLLFGYRPREIQTYIDRQQSEWTELASAAR